MKSAEDIVKLHYLSYFGSARANVSSVPPEKIVNVYKVFNGEPCGCGEFAVEFELHDTVTGVRNRFCDGCAIKEKKAYFEDGYELVYPCNLNLKELEK